MSIRRNSAVFCTLVFLVTSIINPVHAAPQQTEEKLSFKNPGFDKVIFVTRKLAEDGHWYANFGYFASDEKHKCHSEGGSLCIYDFRKKSLTVLFSDDRGSYRDPQLHYDGERIIFSHRKGGEDAFHLYETDIRGSFLRQITDGPDSDIEPCYLPDGDIMFVSSRCDRWVNCWATQVAVLYRCKADGSSITQLSANIEHDNTPWLMNDGRIMYTRWEYIDRSQVHFHHLWAMNPDGTKQAVLFGNQHTSVPGSCLLIDSKPIPGTPDIATVFSPGHGRREHAGHLARISLKNGPDEKHELSFIWKGEKNEYIYDPFPLSNDLYLVTTGKQMALITGAGKKKNIFSLPSELKKQDFQIFEPRPVISREPEPVVASAVHPSKKSGTFVLQDVNEGRNLTDAQSGKITKLLVLETLPKPINFTGGNEPLTYTGSFTLERIVGTVPVESDGSAYFNLPANRSFLFVGMDENNRAIQRMKSFTSAVPGETVSCIGCHEHRTLTPANRSAFPLATQSPPAEPQKIAGVPDVIDFPRDIQPILNRHCVSCHNPQKRSGGLLLTGHRGPTYSHSYFNLLARFLVNDGRNQYEPLNKPEMVGDSKSPLIKKIEAHHGDVEMPEHEIQMIRFWINTGATYPGTYAALGSGMVGRMIRNDADRTPVQNKQWDAARAVIKRECQSCHKELMPDVVEEKNLIWWKSRTDMMNGAIPKEAFFEKVNFSRHIVYDLTEPKNSTLLLAPLADSKGGYGLCQKNGKPIFKNTKNKSYKKLLSAVTHTKTYLDSIKRFDMPGFVVRPEYYRELVRYGIVDQNTPRQDVDPYAVEQKYWDEVTKF
jgi:hypothetical protein